MRILLISSAYNGLCQRAHKHMPHDIAKLSELRQSLAY
jgi:hypothetical protein